MNAISPCPCGAFAFPQPTCNMSGLPQISFRVGDFTSFRYELLVPLPGETELTAWRPGASGDLAMQMVEWWAYLADILTFYNERIANEAYLGTVLLLPESVNHLVQLLGYRPKPALGAKGQLAALLTPSARTPLTIPAGLQIQSKPGPGQQPQVFEVDQADLTIGRATTTSSCTPTVVPSDLPLVGAGSTLWLAGKITSLKAGDRLLLSKATAIIAQTLGDWAWIKVAKTTPTTDPLGATVTEVSFTKLSGSPDPDSDPQAADYVLLKPQQSAPLWPYGVETAQPLTATSADLAQIARGLVAGGLFLVDLADGAVPPAVAATRADAQSLLGVALEAEAAVAAAAAAGGGIASFILYAEAAAVMQALMAVALVANAHAVASMAEAAIAALLSQSLNGAAAAATAGITTANQQLVDIAGSVAGLAPTPGIVASYAEVVWYANGDGPNPPPSAKPPPTPIAIPHAEIGFANGTLSGELWTSVIPQITIRWVWLPVGQLVGVTTSESYVYHAAGGSTLVADPTSPNPMPVEAMPVPVLLEDAAGDAAASALSRALRLKPGQRHTWNAYALTGERLLLADRRLLQSGGRLARQDRRHRDTGRRQPDGRRPGLHPGAVAGDLLFRPGLDFGPELLEHG